MLVLSSPSGAGKTTLSRLLLEGDKNLRLSISATTRQPRANEVDGIHYFFLEPDEFDARRKAGEFLESAEVFGHFYGTPRQPVEDALAAGHDVLFDIDWQGARQLAAHANDNLVSIFVLPPSREALAGRLQTRGAETAEAIASRMSAASNEISHWNEYDYVVINDDIDRCLAEIRSILTAERLKRRRNPGLHAFVESLLKEA